MAVNIAISGTDNTVYVTASEEFGIQQFASTIASLAINPDIPPDQNFVVDITNSHNTLAGAEKRYLFDFARRFGDSFQGRIAIVCDKKDWYLTNLLCSMARTAGKDMESFTEFDRAVAYLNQEKRSQTG